MKLALFDLDGTLLQSDSDHAFGEFMVGQGWADAQDFRRRNDDFYADYRAGCLDLPAYVDFTTSPWRRRSEAEALALRERFMREVIEPAITPAARNLVERHRAEGDLLAVVTATNEFVTSPIARAFGIDHLLAVQLERGPDGGVTGRIQGTPTFREGKITRVEQWLQGLGHRSSDFERTHFYSDSINDLPLLEWATHPVATNPGDTLADVARSRGWPILHLFE